MTRVLCSTHLFNLVAFLALLLRDRFPRFALGGENDGFQRHPLFSGDLRHRNTLGVSVAQFPDLIRRHFSARMGLALSLRAVAGLIRDVLFSRTPFQVVRAIVGSIPADVSGVWRGTGRGSMECPCDTPMDRVMLKHRGNVETDFRISTGAGNFQDSRLTPALIGNGSFDSAEIRRGIVGSERDGFPNFGGIIGFSHGAVPSRGGQGRAVFAAPIRSVFYGRFVPRRQAIGGAA
jgi:hypothetical protein